MCEHSNFLEAYFFQKNAFFLQNFELFDSGLVFRHFPTFLEFGEENKLVLKCNFTYCERIPASDFVFFTDFSYQIQNTSEFLAKSEFVAQHYIFICSPFYPIILPEMSVFGLEISEIYFLLVTLNLFTYWK